MLGEGDRQRRRARAGRDANGSQSAARQLVDDDARPQQITIGRGHDACTPNASSIGLNLSAVSSHSFCGSESATMPAPGVQPDPLVLADGRADGDGERAVELVVDPADGRGVPAARHGFGRGDVVHRLRLRHAAHRRGRMQRFDQRQHAGRLRLSVPAHRRVQVLDVAQPQHPRRIGNAERVGQRREPLAHRVGDERVLVAVLGIVQQFMRQRVVFGGRRAALDRPRQRHRLDLPPLDPHQQFRRRAVERQMRTRLEQEQVAVPAYFSRRKSSALSTSTRAAKRSSQTRDSTTFCSSPAFIAPGRVGDDRPPTPRTASGS